MDDAVKDAFFEALDLPPAERRDFLVQQLNGNDRDVSLAEALLDSHENADAFMGEPTIATNGLSQQKGKSLSGTVVGPYEIESVIGEGGFGTVYLAAQTSPVSRRVALKVIAGPAAPGIERDAFGTEWRVLARMDHPYVPKVFDAGVTPDGRAYFAMEYVPGRALTDFANSEQLGLGERIELARRVCLGVQHLHQKGVIHRDIKPSNVLVVGVDGMPEPRIIDCGIAKIVDRSSDLEGSIRTEREQLAGTPSYMSPEQITSPSGIDARTDVYALGVMLYELVTGELPFGRRRLREASLASLARIVCEEDPIPPSTRKRSRDSESPEALGLASSGMRRELDWIILKAIEKEPERRYQSAGALAGDLARFLSNEPLEAGPPTAAYRLGKLAKRHRGVAIAAGVAITSLVAVAGTSLAFAVQSDRQNRETAIQLDRAEEFLTFATGILSGIDPAVARGEDRTLLLAMLNQSVEQISNRPPSSPEVAYDIHMLLGESLYQLAEYERALEQFGNARLASAPDSSEFFGSVSMEGKSLTSLSRFDEARDCLSRAVAGLTETLGPDDPSTISAEFSLGAMARLTGDLEEARDRFEGLLPRAESALGVEDRQTLSIRNSLGVVLGDLGDLGRAAEMLHTAATYQEKVLGEDHPNLLGTRNNLAGVLRKQGRLEEALTVLEAVVDTKRRILGDDHPSTIVSLNNVASVNQNLGRYDRADEVYREAWDLSMQAFGPSDRRTLILTNNLASNAVRLGKPGEALELLDEARSDCGETLRPMHALCLAMGKTAIEAYRVVGEQKASIHLARELLDRFESGQGVPVTSRIGVEIELARSLVADDNWSAVVSEVPAFYTLASDELGPTSESAFILAAIVADAHEQLGEAEGARQWRSRSVADGEASAVE